MPSDPEEGHIDPHSDSEGAQAEDEGSLPNARTNNPSDINDEVIIYNILHLIFFIVQDISRF